LTIIGGAPTPCRESVKKNFAETVSKDEMENQRIMLLAETQRLEDEIKWLEMNMTELRLDYRDLIFGHGTWTNDPEDIEANLENCFVEWIELQGLLFATQQRLRLL